jgi:hypothetical protein
MSGEMMPYVVRPGDYLVKLGWVHGFDVDEVWNAAENRALRESREDHHVLAPGDILYIPAKKREGLPITKGVTNKYVAKVPRVPVVLTFDDAAGPIANEPFEVRGAVVVGEPRTDGGGKLTLAVAVSVREVEIVFPGRHESYLVRIGDLDPVTEVGGARQRLANLGYLHAQPGLSPDEVFPAALWSFQVEHGIEPTGALDDATRAALMEKHGR